MSDAPETVTGFLVPVFDTDFWYVCRWHKVDFSEGQAYGVTTRVYG